MSLEKRRGFHPNHANIQRLLVSDVSDRIAEIGAKRVKFAAEAIAVGEGHVDTGAYARGFRIKKSRSGVVKTSWGNHSTYEVYNDDPAAAPLEFGGRGGAGPREPQRILLRAALRVHHPLQGRAAAKVGRIRRGQL